MDNPWSTQNGPLLVHSNWTTPGAVKVEHSWCTQSGRLLVHSKWTTPGALKVGTLFECHFQESMNSFGIL